MAHEFGSILHEAVDALRGAGIGNAQPGRGRAAEAEDGDLFIERHLREQIGDAVFDG